MLKKILTIFLGGVMLFLLGCANMISFDQDTVFAAWSSMQEESLSALFVGVDEDGKITDCPEDAKRVADILSALEVTNMTIEAGEATVTSQKPFTTVYAQDVIITYESDLLDTFSFEARANFTRVDDNKETWFCTLIFLTLYKLEI